MNYIHIGLGKTGTSALQRGIFQVLKDNNYIRDYNHEEIVRLSRKYIDISLTSEEKETLLSYASNMNQDLISFEGLVHWNPVKWEEAADKNLEVFGSDAFVILTLRSPKDYLRSLYQQQIHEGNILQPEEFFVSDEIYSSLKGWITNCGVRVFNYDAFDLERLLSIYTKRFKNVFVLKYEDQDNIRKLGDLFNLDTAILSSETKRNSTKAINKSYSNFGMILTLKREKILNFFGLRSVGSIEYNPKLFNHRYLGNTEKKNKFLLRITTYTSWRWFIQRLIDRIVPYKSYELSDVLPTSLIEKNESFYNAISAGKQ